MELSKKKIEALFQYYLLNGFNHTIDDILIGLSISRKTFFNRYLSKKQSVELCVTYWHEIVQERFRLKSLQCNHVVEELVVFGWEMQMLVADESCFFKYDVENGFLISDRSPFMSMLGSIISKGIRSYHFQKSINVELYSKYLLNMFAHLEFAEREQPQVIRYLLAPLLTERGVELLDEMEI